MRYYVDTEFNGNEGQLISVALVREDGLEFYAVLDTYQMPQPWVKQHVYPILFKHTLQPITQPGARVVPPTGPGAHPVSRDECKRSLRKYLERDTGVVTFVGDWPEDVVHVADLLLRDHGSRNPPASFRCVILDLPGFNTAEHSAVPHNALEDARVLRDFVERGLIEGPQGEMTTADRDLLQGT